MSDLDYLERVQCPCCHIFRSTNDLVCFEKESNIGHLCDGKIHSECCKYIDRLKNKK